METENSTHQTLKIPVPWLLLTWACLFELKCQLVYTSNLSYHKQKPCHWPFEEEYRRSCKNKNIYPSKVKRLTSLSIDNGQNGFHKSASKSITEDLCAGKYPNTYTSCIQKHSQLEENKKSNHFRSKRKQHWLKNASWI